TCQPVQRQEYTETQTSLRIPPPHLLLAIVEIPGPFVVTSVLVVLFQISVELLNTQPRTASTWLEGINLIIDSNSAADSRPFHGMYLTLPQAGVSAPAFPEVRLSEDYRIERVNSFPLEVNLYPEKDRYGLPVFCLSRSKECFPQKRGPAEVGFLRKSRPVEY